MKHLYFIFIMLFSISCNVRQAPQEQEWREDVEEMKKEKQKDPREFDEIQEKELHQREVNSDESTPV
jgi:hypothetical protein